MSHGLLICNGQIACRIYSSSLPTEIEQLGSTFIMLQNHFTNLTSFLCVKMMIVK